LRDPEAVEQDASELTRRFLSHDHCVHLV